MLASLIDDVNCSVLTNSSKRKILTIAIGNNNKHGIGDGINVQQKKLVLQRWGVCKRGAREEVNEKIDTKKL